MFHYLTDAADAVETAETVAGTGAETAVKTFFGIPLTTPFDFAVAYIVSGAVILIGIIILLILRKDTSPPTSKVVREMTEKLATKVRAMADSADNWTAAKHSSLVKKFVKTQLDLNKLVYAVTLIIEDQQDISYENVRSCYTRSIAVLDSLSFNSGKEGLLTALRSVEEQLQTAVGLIDDIQNRIKKFGN